MSTHLMQINGESVNSENNEFIEVINPATKEVIAQFRMVVNQKQKRQ